MYTLTPDFSSSTRLGFLVITIVIFSSCKTTRPPANYFETLKKDTSISRFVSSDIESRIRPGDLLSIFFKSLNPEENARYNSMPPSSGNVASGYLVQPDGTVKLNRLGNVKAEGLTRRELSRKIEADIAPYLKDPVVDVMFLNHRVTVMGGVQAPQVINMAEERITVLDALVICGDLKDESVKNDIVIIRDSSDQKKVKHLNLQDHSVFNSPWYYLQPNDIVYVPSDKTKAIEEERRRTLQTNLSLLASGVSLLIIIIDRILR